MAGVVPQDLNEFETSLRILDHIVVKSFSSGFTRPSQRYFHKDPTILPLGKYCASELRQPHLEPAKLHSRQSRKALGQQLQCG